MIPFLKRASERIRRRHPPDLPLHLARLRGLVPFPRPRPARRRPRAARDVRHPPRRRRRRHPHRPPAGRHPARPARPAPGPGGGRHHPRAWRPPGPPGRSRRAGPCRAGCWRRARRPAPRSARATAPCCSASGRRCAAPSWWRCSVATLNPSQVVACASWCGAPRPTRTATARRWRSGPTRAIYCSAQWSRWTGGCAIAPRPATWTGQRSKGSTGGRVIHVLMVSVQPTIWPMSASTPRCSVRHDRRIPALATARRAWLGRPRRDCLVGEPHRQAAALAQAGVIGRPVHDPVPLPRDVVAALVQLDQLLSTNHPIRAPH